MMNSLTEIRRALDEILNTHPEIGCCYLFGSATGSRFSAESDVDLGVAIHRPMTAHEQHKLKEGLEQAMQRDVDLIDLQQATGSILRRALQGTCVRCSSPQLRYQLMRRLVYDNEDFQPARDLIMRHRRERFAYGH